mmetsp:Transcript_7069/g.26013  ORF Transcript_7069/g.26013 Transcript_7069/m.26013 type:complete len:161 (+) Transcript_7069:87-569(+)
MRAQLAAVLLVSLLLHPALFWASATNPLIPHKKKVSPARAPTAPEHPEHQPIDMKHVRNQLEGLSESLYLRDRRPASEGLGSHPRERGRQERPLSRPKDLPGSMVRHSRKGLLETQDEQPQGSMWSKLLNEVFTRERVASDPESHSTSKRSWVASVVLQP